MLNLGVHLPWFHLCILLYVQLLAFNGFAWTYGQFEGCIRHGYMCILLCVRLLAVYQCIMDLWSICGVHLPWVYVQSAIHETYGV